MLPEIQTILYATDLSPRATEVFRYAMGVAQKYGARIAVVHALEPLSPYAKSMVDLYLTKEESDRLHQEARQRLVSGIEERLELFCKEELCADPEGRSRVCEIVIQEGHPVDVILREAKRLKADLLVMGSHGHTALGEILLGSTAHRVLQRAAVPVLLVRTRK